MSPSIAPCATWRGEDVDAATIEHELGRLWRELAEGASRDMPVRTSLYNLVVHADDEASGRRIAAELGELCQRHPSRAVILVGDRFHPRSRLDAELAVQCHSGRSGRPLCHEQMLIVARGRAADHLASLTIPLLLAELPTYLWWPGQPPFGHRVFHRLLAGTQRLIVDSAEFDSPGDGLANVSAICRQKHGVNDLNWARLAPWRETVAQFFDPLQYRPYADAVRSVRIEFGAGEGDFHRSTAGMLLLLGWAAEQLGWEPETTVDRVVERDVELAVLQGERRIPIGVQFRDHGPDLAGRLCAIEMVSQPKNLPPARFSIQRTEDLEHALVSIHVHEGREIARVVPIAQQSDSEILGDELELAGSDPVYGKVVDMASRMAGREVWMPA